MEKYYDRRRVGLNYKLLNMSEYQGLRPTVSLREQKFKSAKMKITGLLIEESG